MVCVHCGSETQVFNSRLQHRLNQIWRRRRCNSCGGVFTTHEQVDYAAVWQVKTKSGALQPFSRDRLFLSLYNCLEHRKTAVSDAGGLAETITRKLMPLGQREAIASNDIAKAVQVALNRFDNPASVRYAAFHERN